MAVPGRIAAGPGGPAESALLPDMKGSKQYDVKDTQRLETVKLRGMEFTQCSPKDN